MIWLLACTGCGIAGNLETGKEALQRGDLVTAEAAWRAVLDKEPTHPEALYGLGWTWHLAGSEDAATEVFQRCIELHPELASCYRGLGSVAMAEGNLGAAKAKFEQALKLTPQDISIRHSLGLLELARGNGKAALEIFDALIAEAPERAELHQARAEALLSLKRSQEAVEAANKAVALAKEPRAKALALMTRSRALVVATVGREDRSRCQETAPPIYVWLEEAEKSLDEAIALGVPVPELTDARRSIQRRRGALDDLCPGVRLGMEFPGE
jgi:tetratricopeptide (TPR) repeat protein